MVSIWMNYCIFHWFILFNLYVFICGLRDLVRGSRGPSTVTLMALVYVVTCTGEELTIIDNVKLLPKKCNQKLNYNQIKSKEFLIEFNFLLNVLIMSYGITYCYMSAIWRCIDFSYSRPSMLHWTRHITTTTTALHY